MSKPRVVHFLGELLGVGEDLIHKLVCNNMVCSIVDNWYDLLISKMSTELEVFLKDPSCSIPIWLIQTICCSISLYMSKLWILMLLPA